MPEPQQRQITDEQFHDGSPSIALTSSRSWSSAGQQPTTRARFPRGEAVHYREHALSLGVPDEAIIVESKAANTGQNITFSRELLAVAGVEVQWLLLMSSTCLSGTCNG